MINGFLLFTLAGNCLRESEHLQNCETCKTFSYSPTITHASHSLSKHSGSEIGLVASRPSTLATVVTVVSRLALCPRHCSHLLDETEYLCPRLSNRQICLCVRVRFYVLKRTRVHASCFHFLLDWF